MHLSRLLTAICLSMGLICAASESGFAQSKLTSPAAAPADSGEPLEQIALTEPQIQGLLSAQKDIGPIAAKIPPNAEEPDAKIQAQLDAAAKKNGFADFTEYDIVSSNVNLILAGFDPETKSYIGPAAVAKKQVGQVSADTQMSAKDKKEALDQLNAGINDVVPVKFPGNIKLVGKYYDKLSEALQD